MVDFNKLKQMSGSAALSKLTAEVNKMNGGGEKSVDDREWRPGVDKAGNGYAVIRFLPPPPNEDMPFVRVFSHGFKGPTGSWYIENSLTTIGQQDPVGEYNSQLWNSGLESDKEIARAQKRRLTYISNVYVITDQMNPENEGKVFLFKYGKKIFDKLNDAMNPTFPGDQPINPFDFWAGANFKLKIRNVEGYRNYDKSELDSPLPLSNDDDKLEAIWKQEYSLQEFLAPSNFKSYAELKEKLNRVLGLDDSTVGKTPAAARATATPKDYEDSWKQESAPAFKQAASPTPASVDTDEDDESLEFFKKLAG